MKNAIFNVFNEKHELARLFFMLYTPTFGKFRKKIEHFGIFLKIMKISNIFGNFRFIVLKIGKMLKLTYTQVVVDPKKTE